ncbi:four and a half LIM domains protein 2 isoform X5 [Colias croceus]|nr:four and a half LIM domains protein 2 isoform X5 [Colias croceus]XP_045493670.1 four and a half LIM domains protein 2 isoform X5 [Colias croceus]
MRRSSSSNSSKESRASREEELKMFTSLEEEEFKSMNKENNYSGFGSAPNLVTRSYSRSRSRERSKDRKTSSFNDETSPVSEERLEVRQRSLSRLGSFEENEEIKETAEKNELIFSDEYTKAMNKDWHSGHFCCWQCDESLTGQRYVLRDEHPFCIKCYENAFANGCEECNKTIGIDSKDLSYKDKHWHEACFLCAKCRVSLVDKQFGSKHDKIYCGNCYDAQFASRCDGCGQVFRAGTKKMEYKTRQWHEKCFCCVVCKNPIGTKSFIPREQEIYCAGCYEDKFATRCVKCNKIITQGGVTYKSEPWHRECFTCTNCDTSLAGQRFTSRDEKPYCADCFGELFAKRCTSCTKPITGIGGTRFISFEDRHWHNDCFICAMCKTSLVGKGFITDGPDVICPECAKQKLM